MGAIETAALLYVCLKKICCTELELEAQAATLEGVERMGR